MTTGKLLRLGDKFAEELIFLIRVLYFLAEYDESTLPRMWFESTLCISISGTAWGWCGWMEDVWLLSALFRQLSEIEALLDK